MISFLRTICYINRCRKKQKKVEKDLECKDKRCIFAVLFNQSTWRQPQDVNQDGGGRKKF